jgi:hypothetical protein
LSGWRGWVCPPLDSGRLYTVSILGICKKCERTRRGILCAVVQSTLCQVDCKGILLRFAVWSRETLCSWRSLIVPNIYRATAEIGSIQDDNPVLLIYVSDPIFGGFADGVSCELGTGCARPWHHRPSRRPHPLGDPGPRHSSCEAGEQSEGSLLRRHLRRRTQRSGGAKGGGQGEYAPAKHVLGSEPGSRDTGAGAQSSLEQASRGSA